ncbi:MAG: ferredoxin [Nocardioides sp.]|jgi:cytochrome P450/ferredoxin-NADP reductase|nr:ferredoxin [Nocardioides sp.]
MTALAHKAPIASGRAAAVYFDPLSFAAYDHPYELYRRLRDEAPIYYNERRDLYVVSRYADVQACLRNHEQLINAFGNDIDGSHDSYGQGMLVCQDLPRHSVLRDAIRRSFGGREILAMEEGIREVSARLIGEMREKGRGDFTEEIALPLAFDVALRLTGAPASDAPFFIEHLWRAMERTVGKFGIPEDAAKANEESEEHLAKIVNRRRAELDAGINPAAPDAITQILLSVEKGKTYPAEVLGLAHLVLSAATDAPAALLSNCIAVLDKFPALQQHLARHPEKIKNFVEEVLRYEPAAQNLSRQTNSEITIAGTTIPANSRVMLLMASANRDERVFEDPDVFDVDRVFTVENKILTFGEGIHSCMGAPLARLTAQGILENLLDGTEFRIVESPKRWVKQMVRGFSQLPIEFIASEQTQERAQTTTAHSHIQAIQQRSTRLTLSTRELETIVRVEGKHVVSQGVVALTLSDIQGHPLPRWEPGAHVDLVIDGVYTRQYSLSGDRKDSRAFRLGILRDPAGSGASLYVHDRLREGDVVRVRGPRNNFPLVQSPRYLFIAGGIGITPILPMIAAADAAGSDWQLVYGGRGRASMAFLDELAKYGDRVSVRPQDETGLLDLPGLLGQPRPGTAVYCCGPEPLLAAVEEQCRNWPKGSLHVERFAPKPLTEPVLSGAFEVYLAQSDIALTVPTDKSILTVVEEAGVDVLSSCAEGTCGTCETPVLEGVPDHRDSVLDEIERAAGDCMMICVSRSCTSRLVLNL